jgi:ubiquinone/menaquinone biosynthesis C-methylase UbiE
MEAFRANRHDTSAEFDDSDTLQVPGRCLTSATHPAISDGRSTCGGVETLGSDQARPRGMDSHDTEKTRRRYDRIAPVYDLMEGMAEHRVMRGWRERLWSLVDGKRILEVGVGTGKNICFYPPGAEVVAIDFSPAMLARARAAAARENVVADLRLMNVEHLEFADNSFDAVVTSCVFCSVPDPVQGFQEIRRVLPPEGRGYFLEHVLSRRAGAKHAMQALNPVVVRMMGANINRDTRENLERAGLLVESEADLWTDIVKLFVVRSQ